MQAPGEKIIICKPIAMLCEDKAIAPPYIPTVRAIPATGNKKVCFQFVV